MSFIKKFTIQHMHHTHKRKLSKMHHQASLKKKVAQSSVFNEEIEENHSSSSIKISKNSEKKNIVVNDNIVSILLSLGFNLHQIMKGYKIYQFETEEEAINVMSIDLDTGKINHSFVQNDQDENDTLCTICGNIFDDHYNIISDKDIKSKKRDIKGQKILLKDNFKKASLIKEIKFDDKLIKDFSNELLCSICCERNIEEKDKKMNFFCGHKFCKDCVVKECNYNINKVLKINCLISECKKKFTDEEVRYFITDDENWNKYIKFKINKKKVIIGGKNIIYCPFPDCEEAMIIDPSMFDDFCFECEVGHKFCSRCKNLGWHPLNDCKKFDENILEQIKLNNQIYENSYKQCPKCGAIIEKNEGCNHMSCTNCNYEFCWICMEKYEDEHYSLYNFFGCPGMKYTNPEKSRKCYDNSFCKCLWYILSVLLAIFAIFFIIAFFLFLGCPFELIKCYITNNDEEKKNNLEIIQDDNGNSVRNIRPNNDEDNIMPFQHLEIFERPLSCFDYVICFLIGIIGIFLQPFYLMFYVLYAVMECYRKMGCWMYYSL